MTNRRDFLLRTAAFGCSAAASPFVTPVVLARAPGDHRLVVIILRGGLDGLGVLTPYGDPHFSNLGRARLEGSQDIDGFFELHPALSGLFPLWINQELAFVHAVSTPYRGKRSHFDGQDFLENGGGASDGSLTGAGDGWLNRVVGALGEEHSELAFSVGREHLRLLSGQAPFSSWSPDAGLDLSPQGRRLLDLVYSRDPLFHAAAAQADLLTETTTDRMRRGRAHRAEALAGYAANRLVAETRIAAFSLSGFDTHRSQDQTLPRALDELQTAILTLKSDLGRTWDQTTVLAMTEFGRTARLNGSGGTDHGTGGVMILAGGAVRGRNVHTHWPGLDEADLYERRDLMPTDDLRRYVGWTLRELFGLERTVIEHEIFPGVQLGKAPRLLS